MQIPNARTFEADTTIGVRLALCCSTLRTIGITRDEGLTAGATDIAALKSIPTGGFPVIQTAVQWELGVYFRNKMRTITVHHAQ
jgi:hypothetical protein